MYWLSIFSDFVFLKFGVLKLRLSADGILRSQYPIVAWIQQKIFFAQKKKNWQNYLVIFSL